MSGLFHFLRCVGKAVVKNGVRALAGLVPFGGVLYDIATDAYQDYRKDNAEADLRAVLEELAQAGQAEVRHAAETVAAQEAAGQPDEVRLALVSYLSQMPGSIRQSLRRPSDPGGTTVPPSLSLRTREDLLPFLPAGLPRFKPGNRPLAADWELVELLGKGGFGEVWKAKHLTRSRQRPVALKFCLDPVAAATLRNEAALHNYLDRVREEASAPGIVPLLETYLRADPPCLMYEFIEGSDLAGLVQETEAQERLTPEFATSIVHRLASIVAAAHQLDPPVVHRDLKLSNVLVRQGNGDLPDLFIADFGIGGLAAGQALRAQAGPKSLSSQLLPTAMRGAFTPLYASPQQVQGERPDPRDDVHALGVLWYQLVTGDLRLLSIPPDWRDVVEERGLGEEQVRLLAACIASRAEKRPVDAADLADRLAPCQASEAIRVAMERALVCYVLGELDEAIQLFDEAIRLRPNHDFAYRLRGGAWLRKSGAGSDNEACDKAIKDFDEAIRLVPDYTSVYRDRGIAWYFKKDNDKAIKDFDEAIRLDPEDASAYAKRGLAWRRKGDDDKAIKDFDEAIRLEPNDAQLYYNRGEAWSNEKEEDKAVRDFNEAIRLDPKYAPAFLLRGIASYKKDYGKAVKDFDEAIRLDPKCLSAYLVRGKALLDKEDYGKAVKDLDEAIRLDPKCADAYAERGKAWLGKKDYDKALRDCEVAIWLDPKCAIGYARRGRAWSGKKDYDKAIQDYDEAIRLEPQRRFSYNYFAWLLATCPEEKVRDGKRAIQMATKACDLADRESGWELNILAAAYAEAGRFDEAERCQTKALEYPDCHAPDGSEYRQRLELYRQKKPYRENP